MQVVEKLLELLEKADYIVEITKAVQEQKDPKIPYGMADMPTDVENYGVKVRRSVPVQNIYSDEDKLVGIFLGDKLSKNQEEFFLDFENIKFEEFRDDSSPAEVVPLVSLQLHRVKSFKRAKMTLEYQSFPIFETENVEQINLVYRKLKERYTYLESVKTKELREKFYEI